MSNRRPVSVGFWPFGAVSASLGPVIIGALVAGFFIGLVLAMPKQVHWRRRARLAEKRVNELSNSPPGVHSTTVQALASK
ncbi:LapA family protein [Acidocella sp.]|uniref:LapA family protein n=1 Tax=Acidocella sp. TaxID=50710 RepID=UPI003458A9CD